MKADLNFDLIESYVSLLKNLSAANKLELISRLSESLNGQKTPSNKSANDLYGAFISKKSADEIIAELKNNRQFNRKTESL